MTETQNQIVIYACKIKVFFFLSHKKTQQTQHNTTNTTNLSFYNKPVLLRTISKQSFVNFYKS